MKITLIDDHVLFAFSLKSLLQLNGITNIETYNSGEDFLANIKNEPPDIVIIDLIMPGISGLKILEIIQEKYKDKIKAIILTSLTDVQTIKQIIRTGGSAFLSKAAPVEELLEAIQEVAIGKQYIEKSLRGRLVNSVFTEERIIYHLSPREKDVLQRVCSGRTIKEIAYDLNLSAHTVQYYHRNVMAKLKVNRTSDLIVFAIQNGLYIPDIDRYNKK